MIECVNGPICHALRHHLLDVTLGQPLVHPGQTQSNFVTPSPLTVVIEPVCHPLRHHLPHAGHLLRGQRLAKAHILEGIELLVIQGTILGKV
jgi:hypothetical protein